MTERLSRAEQVFYRGAAVILGWLARERRRDDLVEYAIQARVRPRIGEEAMTVEERVARLAQEIGIDSGAFLGEYEPKIADALRAAASESWTAALEEAAKVCADCAASMDSENPAEELCRGAYECAERKIRALKDSK